MIAGLEKSTAGSVDASRTAKAACLCARSGKVIRHWVRPRAADAPPPRWGEGLSRGVLEPEGLKRNSIPTACSHWAFTVLDVFVACFPRGKLAAAVGVNRGIRIVKEIEISAKIQLVAVVPAPYQKLLLPFFR